jgi:hypothetical protein
LAETVFPGMSLNSITKTELIAFLIFEHLTKAFPLTKQEEKDIAIPLAFDKTKPLVSQLYVSPSNTDSDQLRPILFPKGFRQTNLFFGYRNLDGYQDFTLQVALYNVARGPWPPYSYIIMREKRPLNIVDKA